MSIESSDFWKGFHEALLLVNQRIDIFLATGYNEARTKDELLDLKCHINELKEMTGSLDEVSGSLSG